MNIVSHKHIAKLKNEPNISKRAEQLPLFLQSLMFESLQKLRINEIIIFGSRARGEEHPTSDWDICFRLIEEKNLKWLQFKNWAEENSKTLLKLDLINWENASQILREQILQDGIVVYREENNKLI
jgi:uncharacterized protein